MSDRASMCAAAHCGSLVTMIEVRTVSKRYGSVRAVDELTFTVRPGQVTGFLGPNGAGKSTTMRMMLDLDRPTTGDILIDGQPYHRLREPMTHVGALLEATAVHRGRTAYHHLLWLAQSNRIGAGRVRQVLEMVGLDSVARRRVKGFSLGMHQRLGLAAALLGDPPVLLLDEPVNGLDPEGVRWLRVFLKSMAAEGRTVFVSSHMMSEMALTADHLIVIGRGRLLADTPLADFVRDGTSLEDAYLRLTAGAGDHQAGAAGNQLGRQR
jgi:ABC-2 type transport system ATP-binding protein